MPNGEHRRRIISAKAQQQEELEEETLSLRPQTLDEYDVGQEQVVEQLRIALAAARQRGDVLEHILFDGPPGLGKTTLAHIIANEMGNSLFRTSGPSIERASDLVGILTNLDRGDVLFIDEIHRLPRVVEEYMYAAMEDFCIDFVVDKGPYAKTISLDLKPFTLIGATTRPEMHLWRRDWSPTAAAQMYGHLVTDEWVTKGAGQTDGQGNLEFRGFFGTYQLDVEGASHTVELTPAKRHATVAVPWGG